MYISNKIFNTFGGTVGLLTSEGNPCSSSFMVYMYCRTKMMRKCSLLLPTSWDIRSSITMCHFMLPCRFVCVLVSKYLIASVLIRQDPLLTENPLLDIVSMFVKSSYLEK